MHLVRQSANGNENWYLVHTRAGKEHTVCKQLGEIVPETLLPIAKVPVRRWGRMTSSLVPLFPCYLFAYFDYEANFWWVKYTRGVNKLIRTGLEPAVVPQQIIESLKQRCAHGPVELPAKRPRRGEVVTVESGTFRGFEAVFDGYLSGNQRVAILLSSLGSATVRLRLPASLVCA
jgi:transcriptional antiterminator RfaH